ncbi:ribonuclease R [Fructilactobacillus lindneri]|uniref:Ribonuclease R n=2 Tax=Fructilactobacillus lindneri TaxID=53444 RepID=A0A0R2JQ80_9LACO|nr:ribonuclease R [Fructilactobacillus lindneri]ANZ58442.1 ribonuclease R [Fructilactobacillus lindneri]ANZ59752.1 ribonuclease R [Fructilactobacillus lindneri]KRN79273.1 ribonuclease R 1 [Fructilactobacillus lindneri DSM 20690 = JCM 11027]POG98453.1 ribonuclease R [Fructilactobacillus lindneri]POH03853.1 ribonuclease R [Fructilactobacillus lindneri]
MQENKLKTEIETELKSHPNEGFDVEKIADALDYHGSSAFKLIVQALAELERDRTVVVTTDGSFKINPSELKIERIFHSNSKGFGFVAYDDDLQDAFIAPDDTMNAMNLDKVEIQIIKPAGKGSDRGPQAKVVKIIERHYDHVVGEFFKTREDNGYIGQLKVKDKKLDGIRCYVADAGLHPTPGEIVTADITEYSNAKTPDAMVVVAKQVIGSVDDPGINILQIVYSHDVPSQFPEDVLQEADAIPDHVLPEEIKGREDITDQDLVTIDAEESKDLDDAVTAWKLPNGNYHLGVHIADVSHYVKQGSLLDREAYKRGTSVYLTDRVIPMLPRRLSNGICSLNEGELRLCMSCDMEINPQGKVVKSRIHPSVMRSKARMTYNAVNAILESKDDETKKKYADLVPMFETMGELHKILYKARRRRGAIDFNDDEAKIIVNEKGHPIDIVVRHRGTAERLIESFMLAANETVAETYHKAKVPFIYRVHETPDATKVKEFFEFLTGFGINVKADPDHLEPKTLQNILTKVEGTPEEGVVSVMMLRSMQQAKYSDKCTGHFGLGAKYYTHFTSPIRRYPDLFIHRLIHYYEDNGINDKTRETYAGKVGEVALHCSETERRGVDTERDVDAMMKAEYMSDRIGQEFDGVVSSVMKFGAFVELPNTVEGLVHISRLKDDYYQYVEKFMALVGRSTKRTFKIGQDVRVKCVGVDTDQNTVDFEIVHPENTPTSDLLPKKTHNEYTGPVMKSKNSKNNKGKKDSHKFTIQKHK